MVAIVAGASMLSGQQAGSGVRRSVYITAFDEKGIAPTDLTAADLTVKEGGRDGSIVSVEPSQDRLKIALAVEEPLTPDGFARRALADFIDGVQPAGDIALYVIGRRSEKLVEYTADLMLFINAINAFPSRSMFEGNLVESVHEIAKELRSIEGRRVIVTAANEMSETSSVSADGVLDQLRDGRIAFYAATLSRIERENRSSETASGLTGAGRRLELERLVGGVERDRLFSEGTKQSGGLHLSVVRPEGLPAALRRFVGDLRNQYVVTYTLPAGYKSDGRISIGARRKGLSVRGPIRVPAM
jgi:hypothetical protein